MRQIQVGTPFTFPHFTFLHFFAHLELLEHRVCTPQKQDGSRPSESRRILPSYRRGKKMGAVAFCLSVRHLERHSATRLPAAQLILQRSTSGWETVSTKISHFGSAAAYAQTGQLRDRLCRVRDCTCRYAYVMMEPTSFLFCLSCLLHRVDTI